MVILTVQQFFISDPVVASKHGRETAIRGPVFPPISSINNPPKYTTAHHRSIKKAITYGPLPIFSVLVQVCASSVKPLDATTFQQKRPVHVQRNAPTRAAWSLGLATPAHQFRETGWFGAHAQPVFFSLLAGFASFPRRIGVQVFGVQHPHITYAQSQNWGPGYRRLRGESLTHKTGVGPRTFGVWVRSWRAEVLAVQWTRMVKSIGNWVRLLGVYSTYQLAASKFVKHVRVRVGNLVEPIRVALLVHLRVLGQSNEERGRARLQWLSHNV